MKNFDTRTYNVADFVEWQSRNQLELSPDFQRRSVWSLQAKSYLVDTIIRGKPMPKLLITQEVQDRRNIRVVVDGQQRLRSILEYVEGGFRISRAHNRDYAGLTFDRLPDEVRGEFMKYEVGVDLLYDMPYREILDIFARLNTYTVKLNGQELLNAKYVGFFKQLAYRLGYRYVDYLLEAKVLTKAQVTRMLEAELTSDLIVALTDEVQTNKNLELHYRQKEEEFLEMDEVEERFDAIMTMLAALYPAGDIAQTNWARIHLFYTLFTVVGHAMYALGGLEGVARPTLTLATTGRARVVLDDISAQYDYYTEQKIAAEAVPADYAEFILRSRRGTTDTGARVARARFVCSKLVAALQ